MYNFDSFVKSLHTAIVQSSESIRKRNEKILDDYFYEDESEIILENANYNKDLFQLIDSARKSSAFKNYYNENIGKVNTLKDNFKAVKEFKIESIIINDEDIILMTFIKNILNIKKDNKSNLIKDSEEYKNIFKNIEDQISFLTNNNTKDDKYVFDHEQKISTLRNEINSLELAEDGSYKDQKKFTENNDEILKLSTEIEDYKQIIQNNTTKINSLKSLTADYIKTLSELVGIKKFYRKISEVETVKMMNDIKRYKKRNIQSLVPKTVRVNYPTTFDYATPDNEKEYKVITTPVEVPLITLVPITNYNIEKATLTANFKFDVVDNKVKIDFSKDDAENAELKSNFGKLEITLSPQETPEGLKSIIESYETFIKRQII